MMWSQAWTWV